MVVRFFDASLYVLVEELVSKCVEGNMANSFSVARVMMLFCSLNQIIFLVRSGREYGLAPLR